MKKVVMLTADFDIEIDDVTGYVVLIYFGLSIILILILLAVGV